MGRQGLETDEIAAEKAVSVALRPSPRGPRDATDPSPHATPAHSDEAPDPLEEALRLAAGAGRWDVVSQLARELEARRLADAGNVVPIDPKRRAR